MNTRIERKLNESLFVTIIKTFIKRVHNWHLIFLIALMNIMIFILLIISTNSQIHQINFYQNLDIQYLVLSQSVIKEKNTYQVISNYYKLALYDQQEVLLNAEFLMQYDDQQYSVFPKLNHGEIAVSKNLMNFYDLNVGDDLIVVSDGNIIKDFRIAYVLNESYGIIKPMTDINKGLVISSADEYLLFLNNSKFLTFAENLNDFPIHSIEEVKNINDLVREYLTIVLLNFVIHYLLFLGTAIFLKYVTRSQMGYLCKLSRDGINNKLFSYELLIYLTMYILTVLLTLFALILYQNVSIFIIVFPYVIYGFYQLIQYIKIRNYRVAKYVSN